ncbi:MAG: hypothetical protein ACRDZ8_01080 [Acidimicrobiales bacterium]
MPQTGRCVLVGGVADVRVQLLGESGGGVAKTVLDHPGMHADVFRGSDRLSA